VDIFGFKNMHTWVLKEEDEQTFQTQLNNLSYEMTQVTFSLDVFNPVLALDQKINVQNQNALVGGFGPKPFFGVQ
jgi:hypothetical protein